MVDPETRAVSRTSPPTTRSVEAIAAEVVASPGLDAGELEADEPARWECAGRARHGRSLPGRARACGPAGLCRRTDSISACYAAGREEDPRRRGRSGQPDDPDRFSGGQRLPDGRPRRRDPKASSGSIRDAPDLCLVDVQLPRRTASSWCARSSSRGARTPVLLMSAVVHRSRSVDAHDPARHARRRLSRPSRSISSTCSTRCGQLLGEAG